MKKIMQLFLVTGIILPVLAFANNSQTCITILVNQIRQGGDATLDNLIGHIVRYSFRGFDGETAVGKMPMDAIHFCFNAQKQQQRKLIIDLFERGGAETVALYAPFYDNFAKNRTITSNRGVFWYDLDSNGRHHLHIKPLTFTVEHRDNN